MDPACMDLPQVAEYRFVVSADFTALLNPRGTLLVVIVLLGPRSFYFIDFLNFIILYLSTYSSYVQLLYFAHAGSDDFVGGGFGRGIA
jgi:hypothetical protein